MQSWNAAFFLFFLLAIRWEGGISGRVRALNLTVPLGSGRVGSDNLGYGPGSGFSFEPVQTSSLTAAAHVTHFSTRTHTYWNIWTTANQRGGPPFTISDWFRPRYKPNGGVFCWTRVSESRILFFSFLEWLDATVRPGIFVSHTREKLGRTCDQIGRTLEPC